MRAWCLAHRAVIVGVLLSATVAYIALAVISRDLATTVGVGYIALLATCWTLLRVADRSR